MTGLERVEPGQLWWRRFVIGRVSTRCYGPNADERLTEYNSAIRQIENLRYEYEAFGLAVKQAMLRLESLPMDEGSVKPNKVRRRIAGRIAQAVQRLCTQAIAPLSPMVAILACLGALVVDASAAVHPYTADVATLHLWHLNETNAPASDSGANPHALQGLLNGAVLGDSGAPDFGTALNTHTGTPQQFGILTLQPTLINGSGDNAPAGFTWFGSEGAFTLEAIINLDVLPQNAPGTALDLITMEGDSLERVFSFRISTDAAPSLVFLCLPNSGVNGGALATASAPVPLVGDHALATNAWFHVAVTYDGDAGATNNLRLYWTRLDSGVAQANLMGTDSLPGDFASTLGDFALGNDARATFGENEVFPGRIDEVRISGIARLPHEFVFRTVLAVGASSSEGPNVPANTLDADLGTRWSAVGDGEWINYDFGRIEELNAVEIAFHLGDTRTSTFDVLVSNDNEAWRTVLTDALSSGLSTNLEAFAVSNTLARYVRIVGHGNSSDLENSYTEVVLQRAPPVDLDGDGLPDSWEYEYFGDLDETVPGDPDADFLSNVYELQHGLDPMQPDAIEDADGDGLPDAWEILWFGNLNQGPDDDPDREGITNRDEQSAGTDPTNPNSIPGDVDGDSLPDAWETGNLGTLGYWAYEDPDGDGYNNMAEREAGTSPTNSSSHPAWVSPRVAFLNDSVVSSNACLMPTGSTYGRAINGVSFQDQPLLTFDGHQYAAWYDTSNGVEKLWLGRRTVDGVSTGPWETFDTGSEFTRGDESVWDAHNIVSLGIAPDGTLHFAWDHHGQALRYRRSVVGLCTTNLAAWGPAALNAEQNWLAPGQVVSSVTYPRFINTTSGDLQFIYRSGGSTSGDHWLHNYDSSTQIWSSRWQIANHAGTYTGVSVSGSTFTSTSRNPYENSYDYGSNGVLHYTWTYRETDNANHDIHYAYSTDQGVTWRNNAGALIADTALGQTIRVDSPGIIVKVLDSTQLLINQQTQCVDLDGRVHVLMLHRRVEPGFEWHPGDPAFSTLDTAYYHYFRDPGTGVWSQRRLPVDVSLVGSRPKIGFDARGNVYGVYKSRGGADGVPGLQPGSLVIASASKASGYTDWQDVVLLNAVFNGEPLIDQARLLADNILSVFIQEDGPSSGSAIPTPLHAFDFIVGVPEPDPAALSLSLGFSGEDVLIVVRGELGYHYQLRVASTLSPPDWTNGGTLTAGVDGLMALPHPHGRHGDRRFYSVVRTP